MRYIIVFLALILPSLAWAEPASAPWESTISHARLLSGVDSIAPGKPFWVGLDIDLQPGWHTYTDPSGDAGLPAQFAWTLPEGFTAAGITWPKHLTFTEAGLTTYGYERHVLLPVRIMPPARMAQGDYALRLKAGWLTCKDICIPQETEFTLTLPQGDGAPSRFAEKIQESAESSSLPIRGRVGVGADSGEIHRITQGSPPPGLPPSGGGIMLTLLSAFFGGMMLNLMPCVFPVLSLKCLAVVRHAAAHPRQARREGLAYTTGILVCFAALGGLLVALQHAGGAVGWGYQMQSPVFVAAMALLLFIVGLSLSGMFLLPVLFGDAHVTGNFATGLLAALVATPCTAPLMAPAVGVALTQPPLVAIAIFEMIGLGLALPFLAISMAPGLLAALPKPGTWMVRLKELLAYLMYASVIWLVWVLAQQLGANAVGALLIALLLCVFGTWLKLRGLQFFVWVIAVSAAALMYIHSLPPMPSMALAQEGGEAFSEARLNSLRAEGKGVFVDATAAWCISCRVNHFSTLATAEVRNAFRAHNVTLLVADWTSRNEAISHYLASFGFNGVPMYVYYPPRGEPRVLPQILTPGIVTSELK